MRKVIFLFVSALIVFSYSFNPSYAAVLPVASMPIPVNEPDPAAIRAAVNEFISLSKKEKKSRLKQAKKALKDFKKERKKGNDTSTDTLMLVIIALFIPPLAVYLHQGETNKKFWITTLLFVAGILLAFLFSWLFILASIIYALIVILGNE
jgi:uncharacterized membrane protein YqaE (UPF0057 family)